MHAEHIVQSHIQIHTHIHMHKHMHIHIHIQPNIYPHTFTYQEVHQLCRLRLFFFLDCMSYYILSHWEGVLSCC